MKKANGLIVVERAKDRYCGVDRNPWPLSRYDFTVHSVLVAADQNLDCYDVTQDPDLAVRYLMMSEKAAIDAETLYCEFIGARVPSYSVALQEKICANSEFLGWDYSWISGDFYSCVYNDLSLKRELFSRCLNGLNEYGLFQTENDIDDFIKQRDKLKKTYPKEMFEVGRFYKVKVWRAIW